MRKVMLAAIAVLLVAAMVVAGCGKITPKKNDAQKLLKDSNKAMQSVKSYKATGSINISSKASNTGNTNFSFEMQIQQKGPKDFEGRMLVHSSGQDIEIFMANGFSYTKDPTQGWIKQPLGDASGFSNLGSPADISKLGNAAQNTRILQEDSQSYKIGFDLNANYIRELMGLQKSTAGLSAEEKKIADAMVKGMQMGALFKIEKSTKYVLSMVMNFNIPNMPTVGAVSMEEKIDLSEFNKPVEVNLPAEAINAPEATGSGALTPTL
jgi:hypothetical protein